MFYKIVSFNSPLIKRKLKQLKVSLDGKHTYSEGDFEYLFILGGDGTFAHFSKEYAFANKKIIGIKSGHVSFLSSGVEATTEDFGKLPFSDLELLKIEGSKTHYAFNDIYITGDRSLLLTLDMNINGIHLQKYRGSGLLLSTKAGSTAKNKSLSGPIVFPNTNAWLISEIGPQQNKKFKSISNSLVVSGGDCLEISKLKSYRVYIDGRLVTFGDENLKISLVRGTSKVLFSSTEEYIARLKRVFIA